MKVFLTELTETTSKESMVVIGKITEQEKQLLLDTVDVDPFGAFRGEIIIKDRMPIFVGVEIAPLKKGEINFIYTPISTITHLPAQWNEPELIPEPLRLELITYIKRYYKKSVPENIATVDFIKWGIYD